MRTVMMCLVSFLFAGLASAQQPQPQDQPSDLQGVLAPQPDKPKLSTGACKNEVEKFCKDAEKGKIGDCLKQHEADLSDTCKAGMMKHAKNKLKEAAVAAKDACKADVDQFCKDAEKGKVGECLTQHADALSADCKTAREKMQAHAKTVRHMACGDDVAKFCKDVEKGKVGDCLKQHEADLSDACKASRTKMHHKAPATTPAKTEQTEPTQQ